MWSCRSDEDRNSNNLTELSFFRLSYHGHDPYSIAAIEQNVFVILVLAMRNKLKAAPNEIKGHIWTKKEILIGFVHALNKKVTYWNKSEQDQKVTNLLWQKQSHRYCFIYNGIELDYLDRPFYLILSFEIRIVMNSSKLECLEFYISKPRRGKQKIGAFTSNKTTNTNFGEK